MTSKFLCLVTRGDPVKAPNSPLLCLPPMPSGFPSNTVMQYEENQRLTVPAKAQCLSFSKDGAMIACGAANLIRVWQTSDGARIYNFVAVSDVISVQWSDERRLYCGLVSGDLLIKVFDEEVRELMR